MEFFERNEFTTGRSPTDAKTFVGSWTREAARKRLGGCSQQKRIPDWITTGKRGTSAAGSLVYGAWVRQADPKWVRLWRRCCKCEVAAARGVNCVDAPRVVCWCISAAKSLEVRGSLAGCATAWGLPEEILRVCGVLNAWLSRDPVGIQSGSSRGPVGIQSGSSRDPVVPVVNSSREFAPYWNSENSCQEFNWKRNHVELRGSMSYACACEIFGVGVPLQGAGPMSYFNVVGRKNLCWLVVDALLYNIVGREKQHVRGWEDVADVVHCWHVEASSRPQEAAAPASSLLRIPPRPLYFNVVCKL